MEKVDPIEARHMARTWSERTRQADQETRYQQFLSWQESDLSCPCCGLLPHHSLVHSLRALSAVFQVTSGRRCRKHNDQVGGSPRSRHLDGIAADCVLHSSMDSGAFIREAVKQGFRGIGIYRKHIHIDLREQERCSLWVI